MLLTNKLFLPESFFRPVRVALGLRTHAHDAEAGAWVAQLVDVLGDVAAIDLDVFPEAWNEARLYEKETRNTALEVQAKRIRREIDNDLRRTLENARELHEYLGTEGAQLVALTESAVPSAAGHLEQAIRDAKSHLIEVRKILAFTTGEDDAFAVDLIPRVDGNLESVPAEPFEL